MRDRDVMVNVRVDSKIVRLLHLQNLRADTVVSARNTVAGSALLDSGAAATRLHDK